MPSSASSSGANGGIARLVSNGFKTPSSIKSYKINSCSCMMDGRWKQE
ncbi:hypothetical protein [Polaromonas sp. CG9_12]|nr:hypothetical protein [Polaromonas sp. CG9_12]